MLTRYSMRRTLFCLPIAAIGFAVSLGNLEHVAFLYPYPGGFMSCVETTAAIIVIAFGALLFHNRSEIELGLVCGVNTERLYFTRFAPMVMYTVAAMMLFLAYYKVLPFSGPLAGELVYFYVPERVKLYAAVSMVVTVLFFASVCAVIRAVTRNCYITFFISFIVHSAFSELNKKIRLGTAPLGQCSVDPFMSSYIISDHVPSANESLGLSPHVWTYNRLSFLALAIIFFVIAYILLKRENLHKGFTD